MTEQKQEKNIARPNPGRAFLSRINRASLPTVTEHLIFWPLTAIGLTLDLWTKSAVFEWLSRRDGSFQVIDGFFQLVIAVNPGAAFGIAFGQRSLLTTVSIVALIVILLVFLFHGTRRIIVNIALALFTAGICGNLYDRIFNNGFVRDFIDIVYWPGKHWPAFNIADSMLCIAVGLMLIISFSTDKPHQEHAQPRK